MKLKLFDALLDFKFGVSVVHYDSYDYYATNLKNQELHNWCKQQFGGRNYTALFNTFYFSTEEQRNWFILRWS